MNSPNAWLQFALYVGALLLVTKPLGLYLVQVLDARGRTWLDRIVGPVERLTYRLCGIDPAREQGWLGYAVGSLPGATRITVSLRRGAAGAGRARGCCAWVLTTTSAYVSAVRSSSRARGALAPRRAAPTRSVSGPTSPASILRAGGERGPRAHVGPLDGTDSRRAVPRLRLTFRSLLLAVVRPSLCADSPWFGMGTCCAR